MKKKNCFIGRALSIFFITLIIYCICVLKIDHPLTSYLYTHASNHLESFWTFISLVITPKYWMIIAIVCFLFFSYRLWQDELKSTKQIIFTADMLSVLICFGIVNILKIVIGRARPFLFIHNHLSGFYPLMDQYNYFSTPSGHVMTITAITCIIFSLTRNIILRLIFVAFVVLICLSRMILLKHFLGDCFVSIGLTLFVFSLRDCFYHYYANFITWLAHSLDR